MSPFPRSTLVGYAILAVLVVVLGGRWLATRTAPAGDATTPAGPAARPALRFTRAPVVAAVVDVTGAVRRPGVYRLTGGSRVRDALQRAGGATRAADTGPVNLAAKLADGQQIVIPRRAAVAGCGAAPAAASAPSGTAGAAAPSSGPVSLGGATLDQLDTLPGVGPATAQKILDWRSQHGGFASIDDLGQVPGIGPKKLAALRPLVQP